MITDELYFLRNNLYTNILVADFPKKTNQEESNIVFENILKLFDGKDFNALNEDQLRQEWIEPIFKLLGFSVLTQDTFEVQQKSYRLDFSLFINEEEKEDYIHNFKNNNDIRTRFKKVPVISEFKDYTKHLDKKIGNTLSPHDQLVNYLMNTGVKYGFLTNGKLWRFYDGTKITSDKIFYEVDLIALLGKKDFKNFVYFYHIFESKNFDNRLGIMQTEKRFEENIKTKTQLEDNLKNIIYGIEGELSLFEKVGACFYAAILKNKQKFSFPQKNELTQTIYENALYFIFRLLFIAYFEDKNRDFLKAHLYFEEEISIKNILKKLENIDFESGKDKYNAFKHLLDIFNMYSSGDANIDIPLFNGGLFDEEKAMLLKYLPKVFSNSDLKEILSKLFYFEKDGVLFVRDYKTLSVTHLGSIYEGLLSYFFEIASETVHYVKLKSKKKNEKATEFYVNADSYDFNLYKKDFEILGTMQTYQKGQIYLKNTSNSRKTTASYYTPEVFTNFLVQSALQNNLNDENILKFKILDNSCGSGAFLIEALNQITEIIYLDLQEGFVKFPSLKNVFENEKARILNAVQHFLPNVDEIAERDILKRLLLKRVIYGVDVNPFSIELTKLSLWIDSFIFGTPLSFIEHHIQCGNALIGSRIEDFHQYYKDLNQEAACDDLFYNQICVQLKKLENVFKTLDALNDTTELEVLESKRIYKEDILPQLNELNFYLNFLTARHFADAAMKNKMLQFSWEKQDEKVVEFVEKTAKKYRFLNYEIVFPEIVENSIFQGFDVVVGNPPWDKVKFADSDFFPQYISNYRTLPNSRKKDVQNNLLERCDVKEKYEEEKAQTEIINAYYKNNFPLNRGSGDTNLFRLFVERNLSLLNENASLNYVLPSALMLEEGSLSLRKSIFENNTLNYFYSFENNKGIFKDIHRSYKFALISVKKKKGRKNRKIKMFFYETDAGKLKTAKKNENFFTLTVEDIQKLSPEQWALQEVRSKKDIELLKQCYEKFPPLNCKWLDFRRELDMTNDKDLFIETYAPQLLPLYQGKMIWQFSAEFSSAELFLDANAFDARLKSKELSRMKRDLANLKDSANENAIVFDREFIRLGFRDIAGDTNERTAIFSLIPKNSAVGATVWHSYFQYKIKENKIVKTPEYLKLLFVLGIFNSLTIDFIARGMVQIHLNKTYLLRIPLPQPEESEILNNADYYFIAKRALELQRYFDKSNYFVELESLFPTIQKFSNQKAMDRARAELDLKIAKLYGLSFDDFQYLISPANFKVLNEKTDKNGYLVFLKDQNFWQAT